MSESLSTVLLRLVQHNGELLKVKNGSMSILWFFASVIFGKRTARAAWM